MEQNFLESIFLQTIIMTITVCVVSSQKLAHN